MKSSLLEVANIRSSCTDIIHCGVNL